MKTFPVGQLRSHGGSTTWITLAFQVLSSLLCVAPLGLGAQPIFDLYPSIVPEDDGTAFISVVRVQGLEVPASFAYTTVAGTAKVGEDYIETAGPLEFDAGQKYNLISVQIVRDRLPEETEFFGLQISDSNGNVLHRATIWIQDDDGVRFETDSYLVQEDSESASVTVVRGNDVELGAFTVDYATSNGTARASQDYVETRGSLAFAQGEMLKRIVIPILRDTAAEGAEQFNVTLSNPTGRTALGTVTRATITINDRKEPFVVNPMVAEMMKQVRSPDLVNLLNQLTGEEPVVIGGEVCLLTNRITFGEFRSEEATQFVFERLRASGLSTRYQDWSAPENTNRNVIAIQPGTSRSDEIVLVGAHLDSTSWSGQTFPLSPGADDDGSGSVAVLTAAQILGQYQFERTIHYVLFTAEEAGQYGSAEYVREAAAGNSNLVAVLNLEMMAWDASGPPRCALITSGDSIAGFSDQVAIASVFTRVVEAYQMSDRLVPAFMVDPDVGSDHWSFWAEEFPAICIAEDYKSDFNPFYHSDQDIVANLNTNYYTAMVEAVVGTVAHLARPIERRPKEILEVVNSDWTLGSGIGGAAFYARHEAQASEGSGDARDVAWSTVSTNTNPKSFTIYSDPFAVPLQADSRPLESETIFVTKLAVADKTGSGVSSSNRLRFSFLTPPDPNRIYLARVHVDGRFVQGATDFDCVTNLQTVTAGGGFVQLPNLNQVPDGAVYGTCQIAARFLNTDPANCRLRIASVQGQTVLLTATAQLATHIVDELQVSTNLASPTGWMVVRSDTNYVSPDTNQFAAGWTEISRELDPSVLPPGDSRFFRLKRTWLRQ